MSKNIIFISEQLFKERTGASSQIDGRQIVPMIKIAQDMHIQPALGSRLYKRLQDGIEANNLLATETTLLDDYITDALIWFTMASLPMSIGFQLFAKGFLQKTGEESVAPDRADLELIEQKYTSIAEFYKTRLIRYLQENENSYPEYLNYTNAIDTVVPEVNGYTCPIFLDDSRPTTEALQYMIGSGSNGGGGGGGGGCGDCPVSVDGVTITGDGTQADPLVAVGGVGPQGPAGPQGLQGDPGADALWNYTGPYNGGAQYAVGDVATYNGETWYRTDANGGNVGDTPSVGPFWDLIAQKGADGGIIGNPVGIYSAIISQAGTQDPNVDYLIADTIGGSLQWVRISDGRYVIYDITGSGLLIQGKTFISCSLGIPSSVDPNKTKSITFTHAGSDAIEFQVNEQNGGLADGHVQFASIQLIVYP